MIEDRYIIDEKSKKIKFTYKFKIQIMKDYVKFHNFTSYNDFESYIKSETYNHCNPLQKDISNFIKKTYDIKYELSSKFVKNDFQNYFDGNINENQYESIIKGYRSVEMWDITWKRLANTTFKKALFFENKGKGFWIGENKFKLNFEITQKIDPKECAFNIIFRRQNFKDNLTKEPLSYEFAELHHKYIPQCVFLTNALWNIEILSASSHSLKHKEFRLVNILIYLMKSWRLPFCIQFLIRKFLRIIVTLIDFFYNLYEKGFISLGLKKNDLYQSSFLKIE